MLGTANPEKLYVGIPFKIITKNFIFTPSIISNLVSIVLGLMVSI